MTSDNLIETLTWKIQKFSSLNHNIESNDDSTPHGLYCLWLYTKAKSSKIFSKNWVTLVLIRNRPYTSDINEVKWMCSVIDRDGHKRHTKVCEIVFTKTLKKEPACGGLYFIERDYLLDPTNGLVVNDTLTLHCEIKTLSHKESLARHESILQNKKLVNNFESLLHNPKHSDIVCVVGDCKKEFKLHKTILAARSPVFSEMFDYDLNESQLNRIEIPDVEVEVFEELVRFIYTGKLPSIDQYALELFVASVKYQLDSLKDLCQKSLIANFTIQSVLKVLAQTNTMGRQCSPNVRELEKSGICYAAEHYLEVLASEEWKLMEEQNADLKDYLRVQIWSKVKRKQNLKALHKSLLWHQQQLD